jgi:MbtH protein
MKKDEREEAKKYKVVVNHEGQYSIWLADRPNPPGWSNAPRSGSKSECLAYIKEVWTDMRPLSLRKKMDNPASIFETSGVHLNENHRKAMGTD